MTFTRSRAAWMVGLAVLLLLTAMPWLLPLIGLSSREASFQLSFLTEALIWALFALSYDLLFGYTGLLSLCHSIFFALGGYGLVLAALYGGLGLWGAAAIGIVGTAIASGLLGALFVRVRADGFLVATGVAAVIAYLLDVHLGGWTGGTTGMTLAPQTMALGFLGLSFADRTFAYLAVLGLTLLAFLGLRLLVKTPLGIAFRLVRENERRAELLGYPIGRIKWAAFTIAGALAGVAGLLFVLTQRFLAAGFVQWTISADALVWTLVGGSGTLIGPLIGTGLLKYSEHFFSGWWAYGQPLLVGLLLIAVARFLPAGIVGWWRRRADG